MRNARHRKTCLSLMLSAMYMHGYAYADEAKQQTMTEVEVKANNEKETARSEVRGYVAKRAYTSY